MRLSFTIRTFLVAFAMLGIGLTVASGGADAKPRPQMTPITISESIAACEAVQRSSKSLINCVVTYVQGHPTLAVEFADEQSMKMNLETFSKQIADPFCQAANQGNEGAYFVVALKQPRIGQVSSCATGTSSDWLSLESLDQS